MSSAVIVYYSMDGNTKQIAEQIQRETGYPLVRLEPAVPYTGTDEEIVAQGQGGGQSGLPAGIEAPGL